MPHQLSGNHHAAYWTRLLVVAVALGLVAAGTGPWRTPTADAQGEEDFEPGYEIIRTFAGTGEYGFGGDGGPAAEAQLRNPSDVAVGGVGNAYIADHTNNRLRRVDPSGMITTVAGTGEGGFSGDGGPATDAQLWRPTAVAVDGDTLYIAEDYAFDDELGNRVRRVDDEGIITTVAGTGEQGVGGDGGPATEAQLADPAGLAVDAVGNLYIASERLGGKRVRKVDTDGIITTVAGGGNPEDGVGDGGPATEARIDRPQDVSVDAAGNLYIPEAGNRSAVRKVDTDGIITTVAGTGSSGFSGDGGPAAEAQVSWPHAVAVQGDTLYVADSRNQRIREVDLSSGIITTVAGSGEQGLGGDNGPPTEAALNWPDGLAADEDLGLLLSSERNERVRQVVRVPDLLLVTNAAQSPFNVGEDPVYTLKVSNNHTGPATGITLTDELPDEVAFVAAEPSQGSCDESAGTVSCELGELASAGHVTVEVTVAPDSAGVVVENSVTVEANEDDPFEPNNSATVHTPVGGTGCGQVVTDDTTLSEDIGPCPHDGMVVDGDDLTVDLAGHELFGFHGFSHADRDTYKFLETGSEAGVRLVDRTGVTVENGTVSGFSAGVAIDGGSGHTVQDMTLRDNVGPDDVFNSELGDGVFVWNSPDNTIADNTVVGNGVFDGIGILGPDSDGNEVTGNLVEDTVGPASRGPAGQGIITNGATGRVPTTISGTVVANNTVRGNGSSGISNVNNVDAKVVNNVVESNGLVNAFGHGIGVQMGLAFQRLDDTSTRVHVSGNQVRDNGWSGIHLLSEDNKVINNTSTDNGGAFGGRFAGSFFFDLEDAHEGQYRITDCDNNTWNNNRWGSAGYAPDCTSTTGLGPGSNPADPGTADDLPEGLSEVEGLPRRGPPSEPGR